MPVTKRETQINQSTFVLPIFVSVLMHAGLVYCIIVNIDWSVKKAAPPEIVLATIVEDYRERPQHLLPTETELAAQKEAEEIRIQQEAAERLQQEQQAAEAKLQREKEQKAEQERLALEAQRKQQKIEKERREKEKKAKAKKEQERKEKERLAKLEEERLLQEALAEEEAELERLRQDELAQELTAEQNRVAQLNAVYKFAIRDKISRNWNKPINAQVNYQCDVRVKQIPGGEIVRVAVTSCNGDTIFKTSVENALRKVQTLPYTGFEEVFSRDIEFTFKQE